MEAGDETRATARGIRGGGNGNREKGIGKGVIFLFTRATPGTSASKCIQQ